MNLLLITLLLLHFPSVFENCDVTNEMATRSLWRAKLALSATALFGGAAAATITTSEDPAMTMKLYSTVPVRLFRDSMAAAAIAFGTSTKPLRFL